MKMEFSGNRRTFIKSAAIVGGFAALIGLVKPAGVKAGGKQGESLRQPEQSGQGYRLTEHIKKYYKTASL